MAKKGYHETILATRNNLQRMNEETENSGIENMSDALAEIFGIDADVNIEKLIEEEKSEAKEEKQEFVKIDKLIPNRLNYFSINEDDDSYKAITNSIKELGFLKGLAVVGEKNSDGTVSIISGHTRVNIAKKLGLKEIPITYESFDNDFDRFRTIVASNHYRQKKIGDILNNYKEASRFYESGLYDSKIKENSKSEFISNLIGINESTLHNITFLLNMPQEIWHLIDLGVISTASMRTLYAKKKDKKNAYENVIAELKENPELIDKDISLEERQKKALVIIKSIDEKRAAKKKKEYPKEISKIGKSIIKVINADDIKLPKDEDEKKKAMNEIKEIENALKELKDKIENCSFQSQ